MKIPAIILLCLHVHERQIRNQEGLGSFLEKDVENSTWPSHGIRILWILKKYVKKSFNKVFPQMYCLNIQIKITWRKEQIPIPTSRNSNLVGVE